MTTPPLVAAAFLAGALPIGVWVSHSDLSRLKIPNRAVLALLAVYLAGGLLMALLGWWTVADWAWRLPVGLLVLVLGIGLNAAGILGAGDAKFAAAAAPFVAPSDWLWILILFPVMLLVSVAIHRIARASVGPRLAATWSSWTSGRRFPMGVVLAATLVAYLLLAAIP